MRHALELAAVLLLAAVGRGVADPAPNVSRRVLGSYLVWGAAMGAIITILHFPSVSAWLVRLGMVLVVAYFGRWVIGSFFDFFRGPHLFQTPDIDHLSAAAAHVCGSPHGECRRLSRGMARRHGGYAALLGLVALTESTHDQTPQTAKAFGAAWDAACLQALDEARKLVGEHGKASTADRVSVADALFVTQALCLYERASVVQIIAVGPLGGPHARRSAMRRLEKSGRHHKVAVGLVVPSDRRKEKDSPNGEEPAGQGVAALLCPAVALARLGFRRRAVALALCEAALIAYGFVGILILDGTRGFGTGLRASGVLAAVRKDFLWNTSGGIFLCVAIWLHLEALFALGDFGLLAQHTQKEAASQEGGR